MELPVIYELFEDVVSEVSDALGYEVHFRHGHMLEVVNQVKDMMIDSDTSKRYPLVALRHDIKQKPIKDAVEIDCKLYIITLSDPHYTATERYDNVFIPRLRPIFTELVNQIARSQYFDQATVDEVMETVTLYERLFWGNEGVMGNDAKLFADWIDCIEVDISKLVAYQNCGVSGKVPRIVAALTDTSGLYSFIVWNCKMSDPTGFQNDLWINYGSNRDNPETLTQVADNVFMVDHHGSELHSVDTVTFDIEQGNISSYAGRLYAGVTGQSVINNVLLPT